MSVESQCVKIKMATFSSMRNVVQGTAEWFEARRGKLTSSQIGVVLGWNPFKSRDDLARQYKTGESKKFVSEACQYGTAHEEEARTRYARWLSRTQGLTVAETGFWVNEHPVKECFVRGSSEDRTNAEQEAFCRLIGGSPDGIVCDRHGNRVGCIEIKAPCSGFRITPKFKNNLQYMLQAQVNCWLLDVPWCDFIVWTPQGMGVWRIPRADTVAIGSAVLWKTGLVESEDALHEMVRLGLYDPVKQTFRGYWRVLMEILWSFHKAAHQANEPQWYQWGVLHEPHIQIIKIINKQVELATCQSVDLQDFDRAPRGYVNWASWLRWKEVAPMLGSKRPRFWGRYACLLPEHGWVHLGALTGTCDAKPDEAYVDFYTMAGSRPVKRLHVDLEIGALTQTKTEPLLDSEHPITAFVTLKQQGNAQISNYAVFRVHLGREYRSDTTHGTVVLRWNEESIIVTLE